MFHCGFSSNTLSFFPITIEKKRWKTNNSFNCSWPVASAYTTRFDSTSHIQSSPPLRMPATPRTRVSVVSPAMVRASFRQYLSLQPCLQCKCCLKHRNVFFRFETTSSYIACCRTSQTRLTRSLVWTSPAPTRAIDSDEGFGIAPAWST